MRWRLLVVFVLLVVGVGAVGFALFGPALARSGESDYLTSAAGIADVRDEAVADGTVAAAQTYGLSFGADPRIVDDSSSAADGAGGSWLVEQVNVTVGDQVKAGDVLATADTSAAEAAVALAKANLQAAQARYDADSGGVSSTDEESAQLSVDQAEQQLASAKQSRDETIHENAIRIDQAEEDVSNARSQLADDRDDDAPDAVIDADKQALGQAQDSLRLLRAQVDAQNRQARDQVDSAQLAVDSAYNNYDSRTEPASAEVLASDRASVLQAQQAFDEATATLGAATLRAPIDGVVVVVSLVAGTTAPSTDAIELTSAEMQVTAQFAEADLPSLAQGQSATVTVTATGDVLTGKVSRIDPIASTSGGSSVVSYSVTVDLTDVPAGVLPGMTAEVSVTIAEAKNAIAIPSTALQGGVGAYAVQVLTDGVATTRPVQVGLVTENLAEIKSGLAAGEEVIIGTTSSLTQSNGSGAFPGGGVFPGGGGPVRQIVTGP
jgi:macrolide-specific efflux system membrane fusion protein